MNSSYCGEAEENGPLVGTISLDAVPLKEFPGVQLTAIAATTTGHHTVLFLGTSQGHVKKVERPPWRNCFSHLLIHSRYFYSASSSPLLLRGVPDYCTDSELTSRRIQATMSEWLAQGPYMMVEVGFESVTFRMQCTEPTIWPPTPHTPPYFTSNNVVVWKYYVNMTISTFGFHDMSFVWAPYVVHMEPKVTMN